MFGAPGGSEPPTKAVISSSHCLMIYWKVGGKVDDELSIEKVAPRHLDAAADLGHARIVGNHLGSLYKEGCRHQRRKPVLGMLRTGLLRVINGHAGISPDLAVRLERVGFSTTRFRMTLQSNYERSLAYQADATQPG